MCFFSVNILVENIQRLKEKKCKTIYNKHTVKANQREANEITKRKKKRIQAKNNRNVRSREAKKKKIAARVLVNSIIFALPERNILGKKRKKNRFPRSALVIFCSHCRQRSLRNFELPV